MYRSAFSGYNDIGRNLSFDDEAPIVDAARNGDSAAFNVLAVTYRKKIINIVQRITRNLDDAEDLAQQALLKAFLNISGFRGTSSFSTWLARIATNEALMWKRRPFRRFEVSWPQPSELDGSGDVAAIADVRPSPEQSLEKQEHHQLLIAAINDLKPDWRLAFETCVLNERRAIDLALEQGITLRAAKSRLCRSRKLLRAKLTHLLGTSATKRVSTSGSGSSSSFSHEESEKWQ